MLGPKTAAGDAVHAMKYRGVGEDFREAVNRQAFGLKDSDEHYHALRDVLGAMRFLPAGRIQSAIGATRQVTPYNCFVSGTIADSYVDGDGSIMQRAHEAAATMRQGGGIGYDYSTLRPRGAPIKRLQSSATGPVSFMRIFNEVCLCTSSSGHRRGAQMAVLRVDHPDVEEFVRAKQNDTELTGFNTSLAITDAFMEAVYAGKDFDLTWQGETWRTIDAGALWETIMRSTYDWAEPGVLFIDQINRMNNLWYCETLAATNPCGEQPLPPFGACLLGSWNLVKYLVPKPMAAVGEARYEFDWEQLGQDVPIVVRAMDNVVDRARYPLPNQKAEAITKRRMGLGYTSLANCGEALGFAYGTEGFLAFLDKLSAFLTRETYLASIDLAREKGAFPYFDREKYLKGEFIKTLDDEVRDKIAKYGIRNSHLTSIAPTGTISMAADNVSSGLEPVWQYDQLRPINTPDGPVEFSIKDYGADQLGVFGVLSQDVTAAQHVAVLVTAQKHIDSAVSKTCNMDSRMPWGDFKGLYQTAHKGGAKGCTTFNSDGKRGALLKKGDSNELKELSCVIDENGKRDCG